MRKRAAHLGLHTLAGERYWVSYSYGVLRFRPYRRRSYAKVRTIYLTDVFNMAEVQKTFAFAPKA